MRTSTRVLGTCQTGGQGCRGTTLFLKRSRVTRRGGGGGGWGCLGLGSQGPEILVSWLDGDLGAGRDLQCAEGSAGLRAGRAEGVSRAGGRDGAGRGGGRVLAELGVWQGSLI